MCLTEIPAPISAIPFPTVTVCASNKLHKAKFKTGQQLKNKSLICDTYGGELNEFANETVYDSMQEIAPDDIVSFCWWRMLNFKGSEMFTPILTEEGLCFAFNALSSHEIYTKEMALGMMNVKTNSNISHWSLENDDEINKNAYPIRIFNFRSDASLRMELYLGDNEFYSCSLKGKPAFAYLFICRAKCLKATMITKSEGLRYYSPEQRQCFFNSDRQLRFYKIYTQNNCESECLANFTRTMCGCVKFSMPSTNDKNIFYK
ncbi:uncharacterized protein LOC116351846 [Contarinia nasturtii]|uniref:uncharacterized protein LOC116351846 n=1 Tax=Contarinia nasturtii TaxID=265458 RepID=UPI0012D46249|nr:uncharacterized protein LOC116351846 [Contarinia nasturtii]